jgi:hypothetical protein
MTLNISKPKPKKKTVRAARKSASEAARKRQEEIDEANRKRAALKRETAALKADERLHEASRLMSRILHTTKPGEEVDPYCVATSKGLLRVAIALGTPKPLRTINDGKFQKFGNLALRVSGIAKLKIVGRAVSKACHGILDVIGPEGVEEHQDDSSTATRDLEVEELFDNLNTHIGRMLASALNAIKANPPLLEDGEDELQFGEMEKAYNSVLEDDDDSDYEDDKEDDDDDDDDNEDDGPESSSSKTKKRKQKRNSSPPSEDEDEDEEEDEPPTKKRNWKKRAAGTRPTTIRQQMDDSVRKRLEGARGNIERAQLLSTPFTRSDEFISKKKVKLTDELKLQAKNEATMPVVNVGIYVYTQQKPNEDGNDSKGPLLLKPKLHLFTGSEFASKHLMECMTEGDDLPDLEVHRSMDGFIDEAFRTESGKLKSRKIREKKAAKAAKKARDEAKTKKAATKKKVVTEDTAKNTAYGRGCRRNHATGVI